MCSRPEHGTSRHSDSSVATGSADHAGRTRVAPQIFTDVGSDRRNVEWSPENGLVNTVARLQQDLADIRAESQLLRTPAVPPVVHAPRRRFLRQPKCHGLEERPVGNNIGKFLMP